VDLAVYLRPDPEGPFRPVYKAATGPDLPEVPAEGALPRLLVAERSPITRRLLEVESREGAEAQRGIAADALSRMEDCRAEMIVPLLGESRLVGWISVGGGEPERYLRAEVAAAFLAVGNQAVASLQRINAQEESRRRETLAAVGELAAGLAHEVRNPVAAIGGAAQAITPQATPEQAAEMLEVIKEETDRLGRVVGEFLDYARPQSPRREAVDLGEIARRVIRSTELADSRLVSDLEVSPDAPRVLGDPDQIRRAFENLIRNAREATGPGGRVRIRVSPEAAGSVAARFEDNGPGIPDDQLPLLFRPFHSNKPGGTGLGLALVHRIVESHGGEIRVDGRPGSGAVFTLVFTAAGDDSAAPAARS
jgi:signal transduction histidine kinase